MAKKLKQKDEQNEKNVWTDSQNSDNRIYGIDILDPFFKEIFESEDLKKIYNNEYKYLKKFLYPKQDSFGSKKGLLNIKERMEQKKIREKKSTHTHGISVTATARADLDLSKPKIFHKNNCGWLRNVPYGRGIIFSDRDAAIKVGYRPCHVCRP